MRIPNRDKSGFKVKWDIRMKNRGLTADGFQTESWMLVKVLEGDFIGQK